MADFRLLVYSPQDTFLFELSPNDVFSAVMTEKINDQHMLSIVTTTRLEKEQRILTQDATGKWREFVVAGVDASHENNQRPFGSYNCVWSLQHDLKLCGVNDVVGLDTPVNASSALSAVLRNTARWSVGTVTVNTMAGTDMIQTDAFSALSKVIQVWGGEVDADITVDLQKVVARRVSLYDKQGSQTATRRFDYTRDMTQIRRKVSETPVACRIRPYGKSETTIDGFKVRITIEEVNDGKDYLQNDDVVQMLRLPNGSGGWEYPTVNVENNSIDDEEELLEWGQSVLYSYTTPKVTYEASVVQLTAAGMDVKGLALGDLTQCVDRGFTDDGIRIESRVYQIRTDLLDPSKTEISLGDVKESYVLSFGTAMERMEGDLSELQFGAQSTADYLNNLLTHLNEQINATGGYVYITQGHGIRTYDRQVADPLTGYEANSVVEVKGGSIRIANTKTSTGEWDWKTVFTSGHIAAELVTAANITAGRIGNAGGDFYIDLDAHEYKMGAAVVLGTKTVQQINNSLDATVTQVDVQYAQNQSNTTAPTSGWTTTAPAWRSGYYIWQRTATTTGSGSGAVITYSNPTCISGREGQAAPESRNYANSTAAFDGWSRGSGMVITGGNIVITRGYMGTVGYMPEAIPVSLLYDKTITFSMLVKGQSGKQYKPFVSIRAFGQGSENIVSGMMYIYYGPFTATGDWQTISATKKFTRTNMENITSFDPNTDYMKFGTGMAGAYEVGSEGDTLEIRGRSLKVEVGTSPTTWSAALEDNAGVDGVGVSNIEEQYYLSTSSTTQTGGEWTTEQPRWVSGKYIWTRSRITWTDGVITTTDPVLAKAINGANETAKSASNAVSTLDNSLDVEGVFNRLTDNGRIQGIYMESGNLYMNASYIKTGTLQAGTIKSVDGKSYWNLATGVMQLWAKDTNLKLGRFTRVYSGSSYTDRTDAQIELGDGMQYTDRYGKVFSVKVNPTAYTDNNVTYRNVVMDITNTQGSAGLHVTTGGNLSTPTVRLQADGTFYLDGGYDTQNAKKRLAINQGAGSGSMCDIYGATRASVTSWSDRRMKDHIEYLGDDAVEFVRSLRPALFSFKEGMRQSGRHVGFYAQDVREAEPDGWNTETVTQEPDEGMDFAPMSLDYTALIAPLVAYAQQLERRIDEQQRQIESLTKRIDELEVK